MGLSPIQCEVMKDGNCTSCTNKCPASYHVKDNQKYVIRTRKVQLSEITVAQKQEQNQGTIQNLMKLSENLSKQMDQLLVEKFQLLDQAYQHVVRLHQIRSVHSGSTHVLLDFLIKKMKEKGDQEKLKKLEEMSNRMDDRTRAALMEKRRCITSDHEELISDSFPIHPGPPAVYQLRAKKEKIGTVTRFSFGQKDATKPNKTILLVGETGAGKSTLIDVLLNYSMQVKFEDEVWFQITGQKESRSESQTSDVIVYQIYEGDALPFSLTVIDTPGFGNSRGIEHDVTIRKRLLDLFQSKDEIHELHAVGLVVKASENRLSDRLTYIYDSVMSLFGKDLEKKIVALITHSDGTSPENVIQVLEATNTKCAKDEQKQPLHFLLDSKQTSARGTAERAAALKYSWDLSCKHTDRLIQFLTRAKPQPLAMTNEVLNERIKLTASIQNLQDRIQLMEQKQTEIRQTKEALKGHEEEMRRNMEFTIDVDEVYQGQYYFDGGMWGVFFYNAAVSCLSCERTCHYPCTMAWSPHTCDVMKYSRCNVCNCNVSSHVKQAWRYERRTRKVQKTLEDVKRRYETSKAEFMKKSSLLESLEKESRTLSAEKFQLMDEAYFHVVRLEQIALQDDSLSSLVLLDFLTDQIREKSDARKVQKLLEMSRRMKGSRRRSGLKYMAATLPVGEKKTETFWVQ
ncbi:uncharacterized protein LOC119780491 [Cyprinodon tularosa]|uniref:uncharacterized protein LOC119780491 n=1 Tax=Cyprinodon tularosa TaxID=77115 RepID=UPI0018E207E4|nr:uncharacterized protein LOC119780491 [Cyprinodon tularosa]